MLWRDTIELITDTVDVDDAGDSIKTRTTRTVFADQKSIRQSEFYQAQSTDLRPEIMFEVKVMEYQDEKLLLFGSDVYNIIRTYPVKSENLELICQRV